MNPPIKIFIGSSAEALDKATAIAAHLEHTKDAKIEPILWPDVFVNGDITFLRIEELAGTVQGALFVVTPDDQSKIRGKEVKTPRANVIFEYGFLTSRLGRRNVALCVDDKATLPSDFSGLTTVSLGKSNGNSLLSASAKATLTAWCAGLPRVQQGVSPTRVVHGYTGVWNLEAEFSTWRNIEMTDENKCDFNGKLILQLPNQHGESPVPGSGYAHGRLCASVDGCFAEFVRSDEIERVTLSQSGELQLHGTITSRQRREIKGTQPQHDGFEPLLKHTREYTMNLSMTKTPDVLEGEYLTTRMDRLISRAKVRITRWK